MANGAADDGRDAVVHAAAGAASAALLGGAWADRGRRPRKVLFWLVALALIMTCHGCVRRVDRRDAVLGFMGATNACEVSLASIPLLGLLGLSEKRKKRA